MTKLIGIKFEEDDVKIIKEFCKRRGENVSSFVRRVIKTELGRYGYLSKEERKALGIEEE